MTTQAGILQFDGSEMISDVLMIMPESSEILLSHGLSCVSCHVNVYENLREGIMGHGFSEDDLNRILADLNEAAEDLEIPADATVDSSRPELTKKAAEQVRTFQKEQDSEGCGFKIEVLKTSDGAPSYFLDFLEKPERGDRIIVSEGIQLFLDPDSAELLRGCVIDFVETDEGAGFKITKK